VKGWIKTSYISVFFLCVCVFLVSGPMAAGQSRAGTETIRSEIRALNLINGLDLTPEQMESILAAARETAAVQQALLASLERQDMQTEEVLEEIRLELIQGREVPERTARKFHELSNVAKRERLRAVERIKAIALALEKDLGSHQLYALERYIPCIIPPKGELRIGQAENHEGLYRRLDQVRKIPSRAYARRRGQIIQRTLEGMKLQNPRALNMDERETATRLDRFYSRIRRMDQTEYELQKKGLAAEFKEIIKPDSPDTQMWRKIQAFLLVPEVIPMLEARTALARSAR